MSTSSHDNVAIHNINLKTDEVTILINQSPKQPRHSPYTPKHSTDTTNHSTYTTQHSTHNLPHSTNSSFSSQKSIQIDSKSTPPTENLLHNTLSSSSYGDAICSSDLVRKNGLSQLFLIFSLHKQFQILLTITLLSIISILPFTTFISTTFLAHINPDLFNDAYYQVLYNSISLSSHQFTLFSIYPFLRYNRTPTIMILLFLSIPLYIIHVFVCFFLDGTTIIGKFLPIILQSCISIAAGGIAMLTLSYCISFAHFVQGFKQHYHKIYRNSTSLHSFINLLTTISPTKSSLPTIITFLCFGSIAISASLAMVFAAYAFEWAFKHNCLLLAFLSPVFLILFTLIYLIIYFLPYTKPVPLHSDDVDIPNQSLPMNNTISLSYPIPPPTSSITSTPSHPPQQTQTQLKTHKESILFHMKRFIDVVLQFDTLDDMSFAFTGVDLNLHHNIQDNQHVVDKNNNNNSSNNDDNNNNINNINNNNNNTNNDNNNDDNNTQNNFDNNNNNDNNTAKHIPSLMTNSFSLFIYYIIFAPFLPLYHRIRLALPSQASQHTNKDAQKHNFNSYTSIHHKASRTTTNGIDTIKDDQIPVRCSDPNSRVNFMMNITTNSGITFNNNNSCFPTTTNNNATKTTHPYHDDNNNRFLLTQQRLAIYNRAIVNSLLAPTCVRTSQPEAFLPISSQDFDITHDDCVANTLMECLHDVVGDGYDGVERKGEVRMDQQQSQLMYNDSNGIDGVGTFNNDIYESSNNKNDPPIHNNNNDNDNNNVKSHQNNLNNHNNHNNNNNHHNNNINNQWNEFDSLLHSKQTKDRITNNWTTFPTFPNSRRLFLILFLIQALVMSGIMLFSTVFTQAVPLIFPVIGTNGLKIVQTVPVLTPDVVNNRDNSNMSHFNGIDNDSASDTSGYRNENDVIGADGGDGGGGIDHGNDGNIDKDIAHDMVRKSEYSGIIIPNDNHRPDVDNTSTIDAVLIKPDGNLDISIHKNVNLNQRAENYIEKEDTKNQNQDEENNQNRENNQNQENNQNRENNQNANRNNDIDQTSKFHELSILSTVSTPSYTNDQGNDSTHNSIIINDNNNDQGGMNDNNNDQGGMNDEKNDQGGMNDNNNIKFSDTRTVIVPTNMVESADISFSPTSTDPNESSSRPDVITTTVPITDKIIDDIIFIKEAHSIEHWVVGWSIMLGIGSVVSMVLQHYIVHVNKSQYKDLINKIKNDVRVFDRQYQHQSAHMTHKVQDTPVGSEFRHNNNYPDNSIGNMNANVDTCTQTGDITTINQGSYTDNKQQYTHAINVPNKFISPNDDTLDSNSIHYHGNSSSFHSNNDVNTLKLISSESNSNNNSHIDINQDNSNNINIDSPNYTSTNTSTPNPKPYLGSIPSNSNNSPLDSNNNPFNNHNSSNNHNLLNNNNNNNNNNSLNNNNEHLNVSSTQTNPNSVQLNYSNYHLDFNDDDISNTDSDVYGETHHDDDDAQATALLLNTFYRNKYSCQRQLYIKKLSGYNSQLPLLQWINSTKKYFAKWFVTGKGNNNNKHQSRSKRNHHHLHSNFAQSQLNTLNHDRYNVGYDDKDCSIDDNPSSCQTASYINNNNDNLSCLEHISSPCKTTPMSSSLITNDTLELTPPQAIAMLPTLNNIRILLDLIFIHLIIVVIVFGLYTLSFQLIAPNYQQYQSDTDISSSVTGNNNANYASTSTLTSTTTILITNLLPKISLILSLIILGYTSSSLVALFNLLLELLTKPTLFLSLYTYTQLFTIGLSIIIPILAHLTLNDSHPNHSSHHDFNSLGIVDSNYNIYPQSTGVDKVSKMSEINQHHQLDIGVGINNNSHDNDIIITPILTDIDDYMSTNMSGSDDDTLIQFTTMEYIEIENDHHNNNGNTNNNKNNNKNNGNTNNKNNNNNKKNYNHNTNTSTPNPVSVSSQNHNTQHNSTIPLHHNDHHDQQVDTYAFLHQLNILILIALTTATGLFILLWYEVLSKCNEYYEYGIDILLQQSDLGVMGKGSNVV